MKNSFIVYKGNLGYVVCRKNFVFKIFYIIIGYLVNFGGGTNVPVRPGTFVPAGINVPVWNRYICTHHKIQA